MPAPIELPSLKKELKCPKCGQNYFNYKEYFACWTSHLTATTTPIYSKPDIKLSKNKPTITPDNIEEGLRIIEKNINYFHGKIDFIGIDKNSSLVLINFNSGYNVKRKKQQLIKYRQIFLNIARRIYGIQETYLPKIRIIIISRDKIKEY